MAMGSDTMEQEVHLNLTTYTAKQYDKEVKVNAGSKFVIHLSENPTTGYIWNIVVGDMANNGLGNVLRYANSTY